MILVFLMPAGVFASGNFTVWAGCSWMKLDDFHSMVKQVAVNNWPSSYEYNSMSGINAGLDGAYWYYSWWGIGGRVAFTKLVDAEVQAEAVLDRARFVFGGSLTEILFGVPFLFEFLDGKISFGGGIYAGLGVASADLSRTGVDADREGSINADGGCFVFEIPLRFTHNFTSSFLFDINFSFLTAYADKLYIRETADFDGISFNKGERLVYPSAPYILDFTGFTLSFGFNWRFSSHDWPWYEKKWSWME